MKVVKEALIHTNGSYLPHPKQFPTMLLLKMIWQGLAKPFSAGC
jgi:hypothetical protein